MDDHANKNNVALPMIDPEDAIIFAAPDSVEASVDSVASGISVGAEESGAGASAGESAGAAVGSIGAAVGSEFSAEIQSKGQSAINSVTFAERDPASLFFKMTHLKKASALSLHCGHRVVIGQRPASTSAHDPISDSLGIPARSSVVGIRPKQRFVRAQGTTISSSSCWQASGTKSLNSSGINCPRDS